MCREAGRPIEGVLIVLIGLLLIGPALPSAAQVQDASQIKCIRSLNADAGKISRARAQETGSCLQDAAAKKLPGGQTAQLCLVARKTKSDPLVAKLRADEAKYCGFCQPSPPGGPAACSVPGDCPGGRCSGKRPSFGYTPGDVGGRTVQREHVDLVGDLFGVPLEQAVVLQQASAPASACQSGVLKRYQQQLVTAFNVWLKCKTTNLRGRAGAPPAIASRAQLRDVCRAVVQADAASSSKGKIAKAFANLENAVESCSQDGAALATVFPGRCAASAGSAAAFSACLGARVSCRFCRAVNVVDALDLDCDLFDDGTVNATCESVTCGDGALGPGEQCEPSLDDACPGFCESDCTCRAPIARAGADREVDIGTRVQLDGSGSSNPDGKPVQYSWSLTTVPAGSTASLSGANTVSPSFVADVVGAYVASLVVSDADGAGAPDTVEIVATDRPPVITDFSPKTSKSGNLVVVTGSGFAAKPGGPQVELAARAGGLLRAPVTTYDDGSLSFVIPPGSASGPIRVTVGTGTATSSETLTILVSSDFTLTAEPPTATVIRGQSVTYRVELQSTNGFSQLATLSVNGLPAGVTASLKPQYLAAGGFALVTLNASASIPTGSIPFSVSAEAEVEGAPVSASADLTLLVRGVTTTFMGRTVVADAAQTPLANVTVRMLGLNGLPDGNTGCFAQTVSDAAGNFALTDLPRGCTGPQLIRYDGRTATSPPGEYAGVDLVYDIEENAVTVAPLLIHLPRIDNGETVWITQNASQDQTFTFASIPGLSVTVYAGTIFTLVDGTRPDPFPLVAVQVPVDRLPDQMPPSTTELMAFIVAFQPANAEASQPVAVKFPNTMNNPPGRTLNLATLDPTQGVMVNYGTGKVSADGRVIEPDLDPEHPGRRYGLKHFDWHGPGFVQQLLQLLWPLVNPAPPGSGVCPIGAKPIDPASGIEILTETDIAIRGPRGTIEVQRTYRTLSNLQGPFGIGTSHSYWYRLDTNNPQAAQVINLVMPDGNAMAFTRTAPGVLTAVGNPSTLGATMYVGASNDVTLRLKDGTLFHFVRRLDLNACELDSITDPNGNIVTLVRNPARPVRIDEIVDPVGRALRLAYDAGDRIVSITDPIGRVIIYTYNVQGTLETVTDAAGGVARYGYDGQNRLTTVTDQRGIVVARNTYDATGRVATQELGDGGVVRFAYTLMNALMPTSPVSQTVVTDPLGRQTRYRFNPQGYLIQMTDSRGQIRELTRDPGNHLLRSQKGPTACGACAAQGPDDQDLTYDARGNIVSATDATGARTQFSYDPTTDRMLSATDPNGATTRFQYDPAGNLIRITDPNSHSTQFSYDAHGLRTEIINAIGKRWRTVRDAHGNAVVLVDPMGRAEYSTYDAVSRLVELADVNGVTTALAYDVLDRLMSISDPSGLVETMTYDAASHLVSRRNSFGYGYSFDYDAAGRLTRTTDALGYSELREYDLAGHLVRLTDRRGNVTQLTFDEQGRMVREDHADGLTVDRSYDASGELAAVADSEAGGFAFEYDPVGRMIRSGGPTGAVEYDYDAGGRVRERRVLGGTPVRYAYDAAGNVVEASSAGASLRWVLDGVDRPVSVERSNGIRTAYEYDDAGHAVRIRHYAATGADIDEQRYEFDSDGRRSSLVSTLAAALRTEAVTGVVDSQSTQLREWGDAAFSHDRSGNRTVKSGPEGATEYVWDSRGRLSSIRRPDGGVSRLEYDFSGNLTAVESGSGRRQYVLDGLGNVVARLEGNRVSTYVTGWEIDPHFALVDGAGHARFALTDAVNSVVAVSDEAGRVRDSFAYEPFGALTEGDPTEDFLYAGRGPLVEGLYYFRARFFDPDSGRFLSEDPLNGSDSDKYAYSGYDPINYSDPTGLIRVEVEKAVVDLFSHNYRSIVEPLYLRYGEEHIGYARKAVYALGRKIAEGRGLHAGKEIAGRSYHWYKDALVITEGRKVVSDIPHWWFGAEGRAIMLRVGFGFLRVAAGVGFIVDALRWEVDHDMLRREVGDEAYDAFMLGLLPGESERGCGGGGGGAW